MYTTATQELIDFINNSPDCFYAVSNIRKLLLQNGFTELHENEKWSVESDKAYFVIRNMSSVIAFRMPKNKPSGVMICASHSDAPAFKLKPNAELECENHYLKLNTEGYGGMIDSSWFDKPMSLSGRICVKSADGIEQKLVNVDRDLMLIPNLAIHMNKDINKGYEYNHQKDLLPLMGSHNGQLADVISDYAGVDFKDISGFDLFLYNRTQGCIWGAENEYFSAPRIDDLQCAYATLKGFLDAHNTSSIQMYCVFDNEETGSSSKQGAKSDFLFGTLERIFFACGYVCEDYRRALANGFMISADNAHAVHPNHPEKSDPTNRVYMNEGVVIKHNANQAYTTDSVSEALFKAICEKANVPCQAYTNRSDMRGGSTLGNLSNNSVSLNTVDIGIAQLAMHSSYETAGTKDTKYMIDAIKAFYETVLCVAENKIKIV